MRLLKIATFSIGLLALGSQTFADGMYPCGVHRLKPSVLRVVQESLKKLGFDPGRYDGKYSEKTITALVAYYKAKDQPASRDDVMVYYLLEEAIGVEAMLKILPPPIPELTRKHNGLECTW